MTTTTSCTLLNVTGEMAGLEPARDGVRSHPHHLVIPPEIVEAAGIEPAR